MAADAAAAVQLARRDLANRLGIAESQIQVVEVRAVEWPTTALGCPEPDRFYAQIVTPGYRIVLSANGQTYEYHADRRRHVVRCPAPRSRDDQEPHTASA